MKSLIILLLPLLLSAYELNHIPDSITYLQKRTELADQKSSLQKRYNAGSVTLDSVGKYYEQMLVSELIPYWYGVEWTFEGHTDHPDSSSVACGYFVSTTMKHLGFKLNRYRMAQQSALNELRSIVSDRKEILSFVRGDSLIVNIKSKLEDGVYLLGLDCHVGYLLKRDELLYFIHSNYLFPMMVVFEEAQLSEAFLNSNRYYIAPISNNNWLMKQWILGKTITVIKD